MSKNKAVSTTLLLVGMIFVASLWGLLGRQDQGQQNATVPPLGCGILSISLYSIEVKDGPRSPESGKSLTGPALFHNGHKLVWQGMSVQEAMSILGIASEDKLTPGFMTLKLKGGSITIWYSPDQHIKAIGLSRD